MEKVSPPLGYAMEVAATPEITTAVVKKDTGEGTPLGVPRDCTVNRHWFAG